MEERNGQGWRRMVEALREAGKCGSHDSCTGGGVVPASVLVGNQSQCSYMEALQQPTILVSRDQSRPEGRPNISASLKAGKTRCA